MQTLFPEKEKVVKLAFRYIAVSYTHLDVYKRQTYTFPLFYEEWELEKSNITTAWDNKGNIVIGNDVWIGYEAVIMARCV